jgi:hypothetical protein
MNVSLFIVSSLIFIIFLMYCFYDYYVCCCKKRDIYLLIAINVAIILSVLNHGTTNPFFKWLDRIYLVFFIFYLIFIYKTSFLEKCLLVISSFMVLYSIFKKNTQIHAISMVICLYIIILLFSSSKK